MTDHLLGALAHEREQLKRQLLSQLDTIAGYAARLREEVEADKIAWWADHNQGLVHSATEVDRLLNRVNTFDRCITVATEAKRYAEEKAAEGLPDGIVAQITISVPHGQECTYLLQHSNGTTAELGDGQDEYWALANAIDNLTWQAPDTT